MPQKTILVVDDAEFNRELIVQLLSDDYNVVEAVDGQDGLTKAEQEKPDLILMDLGMPVMDGWEATRRIRQMPGGGAVRIIALTAQAMAGDEQKALAIGCDDYLAKPVVDPEMVREKVERLLKKYGPTLAAVH